MNDIFKTNDSTCSPPRSMKEQANNLNSIKWCIKNFTENGAIKKLSYPKDNECDQILTKKLQGQYDKNRSPSVGIDFRKLYPELTSISKSVTNDRSPVSLKKCVRSKSLSENLQKTDVMCLASEKKKLLFEKLNAKGTDGSNEPLSEFIMNQCDIKEEYTHMNDFHDGINSLESDISQHFSDDSNLIKSEKSNSNISEECQNRLVSSFTDRHLSKTNIIKVFPYTSSKPKVYALPALRVQTAFKDAYAYKTDLFPLGFESSDCDTSDEGDEEDDSIYSVSTCLCKTQPSICSSNYHKKNVMISKCRLKVQEISLKRRWVFMRRQLKAAHDLSHSGDYPHKSLSQRKLSKNQLINELCVYKGDEDCQSVSLPGSRHCLKHITYNVDQQLFSQCAAKKENNTLCRIPTFDILHDPPLCQMHINDPDACAATTVIDNVIKTKSVKKKTKMYVLSRGKRSKKRRHSFESSVVPSTRVRPPINSPSVCFSAASLSSADNMFASDDKELDDEFKVIEDDLDPKDIQDVLNKIPDHDLSQILYESDKLEDEKPSDSLGDVTEGCKAIDSIISSSFNQQELNAISQVLSNMVNDSSLIMDSFQLDSKDSLLPDGASTSSVSEDSTPPLSCDSVSPIRVQPPCLLQQPGTNLKVTPPLL